MLAQCIPSGASHLNAIMVFWQKTWHAPEVQLLHKIANLQILLYLDTPPDQSIDYKQLKRPVEKGDNRF